MKEKENKELERLIEHLMAYDSLDTPSENFNDSVIAKLSSSKENTFTTYKPLISRRVLVGLTICVCLLILSPFVFGFVNQDSWFDSLSNFSVPDIDMRFIPTISLSNIILYSIILFMAMFGIQVASLKNRFEKSIS